MISGDQNDPNINGGGGGGGGSSDQTPYALMNNNPNNCNLMMIPNFNPPEMDHQLGFDPSRILMGGEMMMMMNYQPNAAPPSHVPFHQPIDLSNFNLPSCPSPTNTLLLINSSNQDQSYNIINQDSPSVLDYHPVMETNNLNYVTTTESFVVPSSSSVTPTQEPAPTPTPLVEEIVDGLSNFPCPPSPMSYIIASFSSSTPTSFTVSASSSSSPSSPPQCSNNPFPDDDDTSFVSIWDFQ